MSVPLSCLRVIWIAIFRSGWVLQPRTVKELQPSTSQLSPVAISWLSTQPMHVMEHLTSWWLMFLTKYGFVVAPIGNSDHSSLTAIISMASALPNLRVSWKAFLKHLVNWNTVYGAIRDLPWRALWLADNPVEVLNEHLSLLVGRYVPTKVIRTFVWQG